MKTYVITIRGAEYEVTVGDTTSSPVSVTVNGEEFTVDLPDSGAAAPAPSQPQVARPARSTTSASPPRPAAPAAPDDGSIRALMPGRIISVNVSVGDHVSVDQPILVMESMKMENTITAPKDGTVTAVHVGEGDSVQHGQTMIEVEAD